VTLSDRRCFECDRTLGDCALSVIVVLKGVMVGSSESVMVCSK
jgi:hypothetical protein